MRRPIVAVVAGVLSATAVATAVASPPSTRGAVSVFAHVPAPGYPALSLAAPDGRVYVGTFEGVSGSPSGPAKVFAYSRSGRLLRTYTVRGAGAGADAVQVATYDRAGNLYLLGQDPPAVIVLNPRTGAQRPYATFANVPTCSSTGAPAGCSNTVGDNAPEPDYAAWLPDGSLLVTDYAQQLIWRVPPHGGRATVWLNDARFDGEEFGPAGIVVAPGGRSLLLSVAAGGITTSGVTDNLTTGKLYRIGLDAAGDPTTITELWASAPAQAPDGFAVARSGHVYLALAGPTGNDIVELVPDALGGWHQVWSAPATPVAGLTGATPWDTPTSVSFLGDDVLVTNTAYFTGDTAHMVVFDVGVGEPGAALDVPPTAGPR